MVKFVERKKVTRRICSLDAKIASADTSPTEHKALQKQRAQLEEDLAYVMYYPKSMKYIALFPEDALDRNATETKATAKSLALKARGQDLETASGDRVAHAILVAMKKGHSTKSKMSDKAADKNSSYTAPMQQAGATYDAADSECDEDSAQDEDDETDVDEADFDEYDEHDDEDSVFKDERDNIKSRKVAPAGKDASDEVAQKKIKSSPDGKAHQADSFFVEEAADAGEEESSALANPKARGMRNGHLNNFAPQKFSRAPPKTKQEARLQKWQGERKQKQQNYLGVKNPTVAPPASRPANREPAPHSGRHDTKKSDWGGRGGGGRLPPHGNSDSFKDAGKFSKGAPWPPQRQQQQQHRPKFEPAAADRKRAPWEVGGVGGVSAAAVMTAVVNKLNGTIVKSTNKKIVFS